MTLPNPLLPGFRPDPSVLRVGEDYYLVNSTFEYLPGIPVEHSRDLVHWETIGHVVTRHGQLAPDPGTLLGAWAPVIRHHDGRFWLAVTDAVGRGTIVCTADDPAGPWSDGVVVDGVDGIDPDLAWDDDGTCYLTYSALRLARGGGHDGIEQVRIDPLTGRTLEAPRPVWSGTGLMFPEGPHLYHVGDWWYLLIAEGGTERGHAVSVARSRRPDGPFEGCPANPVLSARSTDRPVQNTGHGDLVQAPDGSWYLVLLGMRPLGGTRAFSPMGRETFATPVTWVDGWPLPAPVLLGEPRGLAWTDDFAAPGLDPRWIAVRRFPDEVAEVAGGRLVLRGAGEDMGAQRPVFLGFRQQHVVTQTTAVLADTGGTGGLCVRYDELHHAEVERGGGRVTARASVAGIAQTWSAPDPGGDLRLWLRTVRPPGDGPMLPRLTSDHLVLGFDGPDGPVELTTVDGRYLTAETSASFTGRVTGVYASAGTVEVHSVGYTGTDA